MDDGSHYDYTLSSFPYAFNVWEFEFFSCFSLLFTPYESEGSAYIILGSREVESIWK
ncbi:hypothetical protein HAX54_024009, partial [Datura stramonium]|nr:hypothetical protein [Datura stramonium]